MGGFPIAQAVTSALQAQQAPPPPPPVANAEATAKERKVRNADTGRAANVLISSAGDTTDPSTAKAVLLGQ